MKAIRTRIGNEIGKQVGQDLDQLVDDGPLLLVERQLDLADPLLVDRLVAAPLPRVEPLEPHLAALRKDHGRHPGDVVRPPEARTLGDRDLPHARTHTLHPEPTDLEQSLGRGRDGPEAVEPLGADVVEPRPLLGEARANVVERPRIRRGAMSLVYWMNRFRWG